MEMNEKIGNALTWISIFGRRLMHSLYANRLLWLFLCFMSMLSIADIPSGLDFHIRPSMQILYILFVGIFKGSVLTAVFVLCLRIKCLKVIFGAVIVVFSVLSVANYASYHYFGFGITRRMFMIIMQTNPAEAVEFLHYAWNMLVSWIFSLKFLTIVLIAIVMIFLLKRMPVKAFGIAVGVISGIGLVMGTVFGCSYTSGRTAHFLSVRMIKYGAECYADMRRFENLKDTLKPLPDAATVSSSHRATNVVVVIGESASRKHWQLYGYPVATTPQVSTMSDSIFILQNAISSSICTAFNLENILTLKTDSMPESTAMSSPRIIDIFKSAGYRTYWLSNQEKDGAVCAVPGVLASTADVENYIGAQSPKDALATKYDGELLTYYREALRDTASNKLIFLHLLGSHMIYTSRYPQNQKVFSASDIIRLTGRNLTDNEASTIAEYDNTIHYTDSILGEIIRTTGALTAPTVVVYFSDHGANVYDYDGLHGRNERSVEIPAIIYANYAYQQANPDIVVMLENAIGRRISTADIAHPLMSLTGTTYSGYDSTRDFLSTHYIERHRYVDFRPWAYDN